LRQAIGLLLDDGLSIHGEYPIPIARLGPVSTKAPERWDRLRPQLRAIVERDRKGGRLAIAAGLGISPQTVARIIGLGSVGPGVSVVERAEAWLERISGSAEAAALSSPPAKAATRDTPPASGNGVHHSAGRLDQAERERLAALAQFDERELRQNLGFSPVLLDQVIAGAELPIEAIDRCRSFLARS
jgi:hypothetical protein